MDEGININETSFRLQLHECSIYIFHRYKKYKLLKKQKY